MRGGLQPGAARQLALRGRERHRRGAREVPAPPPQPVDGDPRDARLDGDSHGAHRRRSVAGAHGRPGRRSPTTTRGLGRWPKPPRFWQKRGRGAVRVGIKLPCWLLVQQRGWTAFEIYVPSDEKHYLSILLAPARPTGSRRRCSGRSTAPGSAGCSTASSTARTSGSSARWRFRPSGSTAPTSRSLPGAGSARRDPRGEVADARARGARARTQPHGQHLSMAAIGGVGSAHGCWRRWRW